MRECPHLLTQYWYRWRSNPHFVFLKSAQRDTMINSSFKLHWHCWKLLLVLNCARWSRNSMKSKINSDSYVVQCINFFTHWTLSWAYSKGLYPSFFHILNHDNFFPSLLIWNDLNILLLAMHNLMGLCIVEISEKGDKRLKI